MSTFFLDETDEDELRMGGLVLLLCSRASPILSTLPIPLHAELLLFNILAADPLLTLLFILFTPPRLGTWGILRGGRDLSSSLLPDLFMLPDRLSELFTLLDPHVRVRLED